MQLNYQRDEGFHQAADLLLPVPAGVASLFEAPLLSGDMATNRLASLDGEKDRLSLATTAILGLEELGSLTGDRDAGCVLFTLTCNLVAVGGDLMRNLCGGPCLDLAAIAGDPVLQNLWCWLDGEEKTGLGKSTAFLAHGLLLGETRWAATATGRRPVPSLQLGGDAGLKLMRARARRIGGDRDDDPNRDCFSLVRLALSSVISPAAFRRPATGVLGSVETAAAAAAATLPVPSFAALAATGFAAPETTSLAKRLAWRTSLIVSPSSIAGRDIRRHSPVFSGNLPADDPLAAAFFILQVSRHARPSSVIAGWEMMAERSGWGADLRVSCLHLRLVRRYPLVLRGLRLAPATILFPPATVYWSSCSRATHFSTCNAE